MIKFFALAFALYWVLSFAACGEAKRKPAENPETDPAVYTTVPSQEPAIDAQFTLMPEEPLASESFIRIDGKLYKSTGQDSDIDGRCGMMDGSISSSVPADQLPSEDNQSNFGAPYGYQFGPEGVIEVHIGEDWIVFEQLEE